MTAQSWFLSNDELFTLDFIKEQTIVWHSLEELRQFADFFAEWDECQPWLDDCLKIARKYGFMRRDTLTLYLEACWRGGEQFLAQPMVIKMLENQQSPAIIRSNQLIELAQQISLNRSDPADLLI